MCCSHLTSSKWALSQSCELCLALSRILPLPLFLVVERNQDLRRPCTNKAGCRLIVKTIKIYEVASTGASIWAAQAALPLYAMNPTYSSWLLHVDRDCFYCTLVEYFVTCISYTLWDPMWSYILEPKKWEFFCSYLKSASDYRFVSVNI